MSEKSVFTTAGTGARGNVLGMTHTYKVRSGDSSGGLLVFEVEVPPGLGTPLHRHAIDAECFYVLGGTITVVTPEGERVCGAGDVAYLPAGSTHGFRNDGPGCARGLVMVTPGVEAERFFDGVDAQMQIGVPQPAEIAALAARHDLAIVG
jgi:quercetin dioxygenase-like cupin family protein